MKSNQIIKVVAIFSLLILSVGILVAWNTPATGYEPSIYAATPFIFWIAVGFNLISGIIIVIHQISNRQLAETGHSLWIVGFTLVFLAFAAIIGLWIFRGYALWCDGDPLTHIGAINNIVASGHESPSIIYPASEIFVAQISLILKVNPTILSKSVPFIFALLNVPFSYCLARIIMPKKGQAILATLITMTFLQGWYLNLTPNHLSNLMFPLALFLLVKFLTSDEFSWKILFFIIIFLYPTFHPVPAFSLLLILLTFWPSSRETIIVDQQSTSYNINKFLPNIVAAIVLAGWMIAWLSSFSYWSDMIRNLQSAFTGNTQTNLDILVGTIGYVSQYNYSVIQMFFKTYGGTSILLLLTIITLPILWRRRNSDLKNKNLLKMVFPLVASAIIVMIFYVINFNVEPVRFIIYIVILSTLFSGFVLYEIMIGIPGLIRQSLFTRLFVAILITALFASGILILYPSKYVLDNNWQITQTEITGMNWFLDTKDTSIKETSILLPVFRYADLLLTPDEESQREDIYYYNVPKELQVQYHFGYNEYNNLGQEYSQNLYLLLDPADKAFYQDVVPNMAKIRFDDQDYAKLDNDFTVGKTYTNSGLDVYYIQSVANGNK